MSLSTASVKHATSVPAKVSDPGMAGATLIGFVLFQFACQLLLLVPQLGTMRVVIRAGSQGISLVFLFLIPSRGKMPPAAMAARFVLAILALGVLLNPRTNSFASGIAQFALYMAILAPLWWVPRLRVRVDDLRTLLVIIWLFHVASSAVGVIQTRFPGTLQPPISTIMQQEGPDYLDSMMITLANGSRVYRPMGLTDMPGGAATAGMYAVLLSLGMLLAARSDWNPLLLTGGFIVALVGMSCGFFCLYVSQVRSLVVMTGISALAAVALAWWRGNQGRALVVGAMIVGFAVASFYSAAAIGGEAVTGRLRTLIEDDPGKVYYYSRGFFLQYTLQDLVPKYPFGAGVGRWGMMYNYFGNKDDPLRDLIWSEIQWTGWVIDGGIPMLLAYPAALGSICWTTLMIARRRDELGAWGALMLAYNIGAVALTFNCNLFISQTGIEFWLLNAALYTAWWNCCRGAPQLARRTP